MQNCIAIIQARLGSTRLPGKVLREVSGKPLLWFMVERLRTCKQLDKIVIATTDKDFDQPIVDFCDEQNIDCYRGDESDVLKRYYGCAQKFKADIVVRLTGDCPLLDPELLDELIKAFLDEPGKDYIRTAESYPEGYDMEVMTFRALEKAFQESSLASEREHVTSFIRNHPEIFKTQTVEFTGDYGELRITVDEDADFKVVSRVITSFYPDNIYFTYKELIALYEEQPELFIINKDIERNEGYRKSLEKDRTVK